MLPAVFNKRVKVMLKNVVKKTLFQAYSQASFLLAMPLMILLLCAAACDDSKKESVASKSHSLIKKKRKLGEKGILVPKDEPVVAKDHSQEESFVGSKDEKSLANFKSSLEIEVRKHPQDVVLKYRLANVYWQLGEYFLASALFRQVATLAESKKIVLPDGTNLVDASRYLEIKSKYDGAIVQNPQCCSSSVEESLAACKEYLSKGFLYGKEEIAAMIKVCHSWLFEKYASNVEHYLNRNNTLAAEGVLKNLHKRFNEAVFSPQKNYLECRVIKAKLDQAIEKNTMHLAENKDLLDIAQQKIEEMDHNTVWRHRATSLFEDKKSFFSKLTLV